MSENTPTGDRPPQEVDRGAKEQAGNWLTLIVFATLVVAGTLWHEPWRDEADAWLLARDHSLTGLFHWTRYVGSPGLWYLVQMPFAQGGLPYQSQGLLNATFAIAPAALVLWHLPLPGLARLLLIFSCLPAYEYGVIARSYGLSLLLVSVITLHPDLFRAGRTVAAYPFTKTTSVLPYLPQPRFWYPETGEYGSQMRWDLTTTATLGQPLGEILRRIDQAFPPARPLLVLTNGPLPESELLAHDLLLHNDRKNVLLNRETFWLYRRSGSAQPRTKAGEDQGEAELLTVSSLD